MSQAQGAGSKVNGPRGICRRPPFVPAGILPKTARGTLSVFSPEAGSNLVSPTKPSCVLCHAIKVPCTVLCKQASSVLGVDQESLCRARYLSENSTWICAGPKQGKTMSQRTARRPGQSLRWPLSWGPLDGGPPRVLIVICHPPKPRVLVQ